MLRAIRRAASLSLLLGVAACSVFGSEAAPEPGFTPVLAEPPFEVRDYGPLVIAKTPMADGQNAAFGRLFGYISGKNKGARNIAMTAPVLKTDDAGMKIAMTAPVLQGTDGRREMVFVLSDDLTIETAPLPTDPLVQLSVVPPRRVAVVRYSGSMDGEAGAEEARLRDWMQRNDLKPIGPAEVAGYNPPWTLPPFRRNEILIPIAPGPSSPGPMSDQSPPRP